jgi:predicted glycosyltransferase
VFISSESRLPEELSPYNLPISVDKMHHLMAFANLYIGESATMASECAVLGVPAIFIATTGRGYTTEQEQKKRTLLHTPYHAGTLNEEHEREKGCVDHPPLLLPILVTGMPSLGLE